MRENSGRTRFYQLALAAVARLDEGDRGGGGKRERKSHERSRLASLKPALRSDKASALRYKMRADRQGGREMEIEGGRKANIDGGEESQIDDGLIYFTPGLKSSRWIRRSVYQRLLIDKRK